MQRASAIDGNIKSGRIYFTHEKLQEKAHGRATVTVQREGKNFPRGKCNPCSFYHFNKTSPRASRIVIHAQQLGSFTTGYADPGFANMNHFPLRSENIAWKTS